MKVLHPGKWWAIRGNHETREVNGNQVLGRAARARVRALRREAAGLLLQCLLWFSVQILYVGVQRVCTNFCVPPRREEGLQSRGLTGMRVARVRRGGGGWW